MGKEISLIAFLDEVVSRNTQHYRKDFELDAQKLRDALNSPYMDERIFYFMSRPIVSKATTTSSSVTWARQWDSRSIGTAPTVVCR